VEGAREQRVGRATSHSLKGKTMGAGLFKLCRETGGKYHETGGKYHESLARDGGKPRGIMRSCTNCTVGRLFGPK